MAVIAAKEPTAKQLIPGSRTVLHVSSAHRVSDERIAQKEASALHDAGYDVTVLALRSADGAQLPSGPRFVQYDVPSSRPYRFLIRLPWLLAFCFRHRYDVYHLHDPDLVLLGFFLKALGRRVIYDVHECYSMVVLDRAWIPRPLRPLLSRCWRGLESQFVRRADLTIAAHDTVKQQFAGGRVITLRNFPDLDDPVGLSAIAMAKRPFRVIYHGDLTEQRGLLTMIDAVANVSCDTEANLRLAGSISPSLLNHIGGKPGMRRTTYLGWLNRKQLAEELGAARAGLVLLHPTNNYQKILPNKLYEYMAAGLPVIASDFAHWREIVELERCGLLVNPMDASAIADAIEHLFAHPDEAAEMGKCGREAAKARYNWWNERERLILGYSDLFVAER